MLDEFGFNRVVSDTDLTTLIVAGSEGGDLAGVDDGIRSSSSISRAGPDDSNVKITKDMVRLFAKPSVTNRDSVSFQDIEKLFPNQTIGAKRASESKRPAFSMKTFFKGPAAASSGARDSPLSAVAETAGTSSRVNRSSTAPNANESNNNTISEEALKGASSTTRYSRSESDGSRRGSATTISTPLSSMFSRPTDGVGGPAAGSASKGKPPTIKSGAAEIRARAKTGSGKETPHFPISTASSTSASAAAAAAGGSSSSSSQKTAMAFRPSDDEDAYDPVFNMLDNYSAILCSALCHSELIESLCFLAANGSVTIAGKSRALLVNFMRLLSRSFPENQCSELLTIPYLVEFAACVNPGREANKAYKSGQTLVALADAFALSPLSQFAGVSPSILPVKEASSINASIRGSVRADGSSVNSPLSSASLMLNGRAGVGNVNGGATSLAIPRNAVRRNSSTPMSSTLAAVTATSSATNDRSSLAMTSNSNGSGGAGGNTLSSGAIGANSGGGGSSGGSGTSDGNIGRQANLPSLNLQNITELADELVISMNTNINGISSVSDVAETGSTSALKDLMTALAPSMDKNELTKQMDQSRVLGNHGKEPYKWDWSCISDMLEFSFAHSDRLNEALKTKWIRRVSGFFRCSTDEKGYFANLEWEPTYLQYWECACKMYSILLRDEAGLTFMSSDRRGLLFSEISREVESLILLAANNGGGVHSQSISANVGLPPVIQPKNVFRQYSCNFTMAREFFTLLGRMLRTASIMAGRGEDESAAGKRQSLSVAGPKASVTTGSRQLLDSTNIFNHLCGLGAYSSLDYLSRLVLVSLSFSDGGFMSKHLIQIWTTQCECSTKLRDYLHGVIRVLLSIQGSACGGGKGKSGGSGGLGGGGGSSGGSAAGGAVGGGGGGVDASMVRTNSWAVDALVNQVTLSESDSPSAAIFRALDEASHNRSFLSHMISKRPKLVNEPLAYKALIRFCAIPDGISLLQQQDWLDAELDAWAARKCTSYAETTEQRVSVAFAIMPSSYSYNSSRSAARIKLPVNLNQHGEEDELFIPPLPPAGGAAASNSSSSSSNNNNIPATHSVLTFGTNGVDPIPVNVNPMSQSSSGANPGVDTYDFTASSMMAPDLSTDPAAIDRDANRDLVVDMQGLLRIPFNMEVRLNSMAGYAPTGSSSANASECLKIDTFLDIADMVSPLCDDSVTDATRLVKVRGIVLDNAGYPTSVAVAQNKVVHSTLMAGICPITRLGRLQPMSEAIATGRKQKRRSSVMNSGPGGALAHGAERVASTTRSSISAMTHGGNTSQSQSSTNYLTQEGDADTSPTIQQEHLYDWSLCKPGHRQSANHIIQLTNDKFAVCIPGEPAVWIFSKKPPTIDPSLVSATGIVAPAQAHSGSPRTTQSKRPLSSRAPPADLCDWPESGRSGGGGGNEYYKSATTTSSYGMLYLVEIQYFLRLETGQAPFVPMPRHLYGELARSGEGCSVLVKRNIIHNLVRVVRSAKSHSSSSELRSALWSLGHIASSDFGFNIVIGIDYYFIDFCVDRVLNCPNYSMRGTYFYVLGLVSRSQRGCARLQKLKWYSVSHSTSAAVALPYNPSILFRSAQSIHTGSGSSVAAAHSQAVEQLAVSESATGEPQTATSAAVFATTARNPSIQSSGRSLPAGFMASSHTFNTDPSPTTTEITRLSREVLSIISKMPGIIFYRECSAKLDRIRLEHREVFDSRELYAAVHSLFEMHSFKLSLRRDIIRLFSNAAKSKPVVLSTEPAMA